MGLHRQQRAQLFQPKEGSSTVKFILLIFHRGNGLAYKTPNVFFVLQDMRSFKLISLENNNKGCRACGLINTVQKLVH